LTQENCLLEGFLCLFKLRKNEEPLKIFVHIIHRDKCWPEACLACCSDDLELWDLETMWHISKQGVEQDTYLFIYISFILVVSDFLESMLLTQLLVLQ
jgi:hypothetical protein